MYSQILKKTQFNFSGSNIGKSTFMWVMNNLLQRQKAFGKQMDNTEGKWLAEHDKSQY